MYNKFNYWLGGWRVPLPCIFGGFGTLKKIFFFFFFFFRFLQSKNKRREKSEISPKNRGNVVKSTIGGDILSIFTDNRNFTDISAEISEISFLGHFISYYRFIILGFFFVFFVIKSFYLLLYIRLIS